MAASPSAADAPAQETWSTMDEPNSEHIGVGGDAERETVNGGPMTGDDPASDSQEKGGEDYRSDIPVAGLGGKPGPPYREKQVKPNKVYIGGLPEHTRHEDLQSCFGKIGRIVNIELKLGYGFVEFDTREAAEEGVAKYHEGYFMGNKIRVEISHGGGRTAKYPGDPGACFKCGQMGHWARECPNNVIAPGPQRKAGSHHGGHSQPPGTPLLDRMSTTSRDHPPPPPLPSRDYPPYRDDYGPGRYPPTRDQRYSYDYPPPPPGRDYRRPASPPRDYRDYPGAPPRPSRDYDDYRMRGHPPPPPPPRGGYYQDGPPGYPPRAYDTPHRDAYDRTVDKRGPPPERYPPYPPPGARPRTPPGIPPPRARDDYDRIPPREYAAPPSEYRGRQLTPPPPPSSRYADYPPRNGAVDPSLNRFRRRSQSPPPRSGGSGYRASGYVNDQVPDPAGYPPSGPPYGSAPGGFSGNNYPGGPPLSGPPRGSGPPRDRDYQSRNGGESSAGYSRRP